MNVRGKCVEDGGVVVYWGDLESGKACGEQWKTRGEQVRRHLCFDLGSWKIRYKPGLVMCQPHKR